MKHFKHRRSGANAPFIDPAFADALAGGSQEKRNRKVDHKARQLCRQVQRVLTLCLGTGSGDEVLGQVQVADVIPAPGAGRLLVQVTLPAHVNVADALARLAQAAPRLRAEVARAITRKRAPELTFVPSGPTEVTP